MQGEMVFQKSAEKFSHFAKGAPRGKNEKRYSKGKREFVKIKNFLRNRHRGERGRIEPAL